MYYAPFITPVENERLNRKCMRDILPENNEGVPLVVQVLANKKEAYFRFENEALAFGYRNININFGCPSGTVVKKDRGAGFLREREALDGFLGAVFEETSAKISVKKWNILWKSTINILWSFLLFIPEQGRIITRVFRIWNVSKRYIPHHKTSFAITEIFFLRTASTELQSVFLSSIVL